MGYTLILIVGVLATLFLYNEAKVHQVRACEGHEIKLHCPYRQMIRILKADYGRWDAASCPYYDDPNMTINCHSQHTPTIFSATCDGHQNCKLQINNDNFMDPCPGQVKYAEAAYICVPKPKKTHHTSGFGNTNHNEIGDDIIAKGVQSLFNAGLRYNNN